ncbi:MAG: hypothetical protein JKY56_01525 [Kofleriaceae bacterium]|nr:hypothetical protein [Kofleriaceae bacterium]
MAHRQQISEQAYAGGKALVLASIMAFQWACSHNEGLEEAHDKSEMPETAEVSPVVPSKGEPGVKAKANVADEFCKLDRRRSGTYLELQVVVPVSVNGWTVDGPVGYQPEYVLAVNCWRPTPKHAKELGLSRGWDCSGAKLSLKALATSRLRANDLSLYEPELLGPKELRKRMARYKDIPRHQEQIEKYRGYIDNKTGFWLEGSPPQIKYFLDFKKEKLVLIYTGGGKQFEKELEVPCKIHR